MWALFTLCGNVGIVWSRDAGMRGLRACCALRSLLVEFLCTSRKFSSSNPAGHHSPPIVASSHTSGYARQRPPPSAPSGTNKSLINIPGLFDMAESGLQAPGSQSFALASRITARATRGQHSSTKCHTWHVHKAVT